VVMEVLGHSQISMTLDTYSHVGADLLGDATKAMNASIRPAWKPDGYKNGYSGARGTRPGRVVGATSEIGSRAGAEGFEPSNGGSKVPCLTTWRRPKAGIRLAWADQGQPACHGFWFREAEKSSSRNR